MCLVPLVLAAGLGALLYIMIKDEVQLKETFIRFIKWGYIDVAWNEYKVKWLKQMLTFTDIRKWDDDET